MLAGLDRGEIDGGGGSGKDCGHGVVAPRDVNWTVLVSPSLRTASWPIRRGYCPKHHGCPVRPAARGKAQRGVVPRSAASRRRGASNRIPARESSGLFAGLEHIVFFHVITEGRCQVRLAAGGAAIEVQAPATSSSCAQDDTHVLGSDLQLAPVDADSLVRPAPPGGMLTIDYDGGGERDAADVRLPVLRQAAQPPAPGRAAAPGARAARRRPGRRVADEPAAPRRAGDIAPRPGLGHAARQARRAAVRGGDAPLYRVAAGAARSAGSPACATATSGARSR